MLRPPPIGRCWLGPSDLVAGLRGRSLRGGPRGQGAQIVILSLQWGTEYHNEPDEGQLDLARVLSASPDIDLIIGHHVHVASPSRRSVPNGWRTVWVISPPGFPDGFPENSQDAVVPLFTFTRTASGRWTVTGVEVLATWMEYQPAARVVDLSAKIGDPRLPASRRLDYTRIRERIAGYVDQRGAVRDGLRMRQ